jgi:hypothetical protein
MMKHAGKGISIYSGKRSIAEKKNKRGYVYFWQKDLLSAKDKKRNATAESL